MKLYFKKITLAAAAMFAASCIWAQDSPGNLVYNEIDDSPVAGNCGTMVDGTTFSSPTFATIPVTHASILSKTVISVRVWTTPLSAIRKR